MIFGKRLGVVFIGAVLSLGSTSGLTERNQRVLLHTDKPSPSRINTKMEITEKESRLIEWLRKNGLPFGEMVIRLFFQDGVAVRMVIEDKKPSIKL